MGAIAGGVGDWIGSGEIGLAIEIEPDVEGLLEAVLRPFREDLRVFRLPEPGLGTRLAAAPSTGSPTVIDRRSINGFSST